MRSLNTSAHVRRATRSDELLCICQRPLRAQKYWQYTALLGHYYQNCGIGTTPVVPSPTKEYSRLWRVAWFPPPGGPKKLKNRNFKLEYPDTREQLSSNAASYTVYAPRGQSMLDFRAKLDSDYRPRWKFSDKVTTDHWPPDLHQMHDPFWWQCWWPR
jgi:hypothetical protein